MLLMLPRWSGIGMFVDGITYATVARNLVEATPLQLWELHYTATVHPQFYEQPPLGIWLMAGAFAVFGDVSWAETAYAVAMSVAFLGALVALWRAAAPGALGCWAFCALVFICPMTSWVLANNMLEAPLTVFCLLALTCLLRGAQSTAWISAAWGAGGGMCLVAACLSKGPPALFLCVWPGVAWFVWPARRKALLCSGIGAGVVALASVAALAWHADAQAYLATYLQRQVWQSLQGARETASWRGVALVRLFSEMALPCLVIAALAWRDGGFKRATHLRGFEPWRLGRDQQAYGALALAASLPVLISPKQSGWYIFQSLPLYALTLALGFRPLLLRLQTTFIQNTRAVSALAVGLACLACVVGGCRLGRIDKHKDFHRDLAQLAFAPEYAAVQVCPTSLLKNWGLHANMARYFHASLSADAAPWRLVDNQAACEMPSSCNIANRDASRSRYVLYRCD
jgi:4-amino-4-deoxy-L-arabinose transferase-like glycosyltransferase